MSNPQTNENMPGGFPSSQANSNPFQDPQAITASYIVRPHHHQSVSRQTLHVVRPQEFIPFDRFRHSLYPNATVTMVSPASSIHPNAATTRMASPASSIHPNAATTRTVRPGPPSVLPANAVPQRGNMFSTEPGTRARPARDTAQSAMARLVAAATSVQNQIRLRYGSPTPPHPAPAPVDGNGNSPQPEMEFNPFPSIVIVPPGQTQVQNGLSQVPIHNTTGTIQGPTREEATLQTGGPTQEERIRAMIRNQEHQDRQQILDRLESVSIQRTPSPQPPPQQPQAQRMQADSQPQSQRMQGDPREHLSNLIRMYSERGIPPTNMIQDTLSLLSEAPNRRIQVPPVLSGPNPFLTAVNGHVPTMLIPPGWRPGMAPRSQPVPFRPNSRVHDSFRQKRVCKVDCLYCSHSFSERGMKAILLADTNVELYSTDVVPKGKAQLVGDYYVTENCQCRIRDVACLGCGNVVGYTVTQPCEGCLRACNNGHFWMFHAADVSVEPQINNQGNPLLWGELPSIEKEPIKALELR